MDAVAEMRTDAERALKGWLSDGDTVLKTAQAAGVDLADVFDGTRVVKTMTGTIGAGGRPTIGSSARRGRRTTTTRRTRTSGGVRKNGGGLTGEQLLATLQTDGPMNQSQLATHFGVARQTIAKRMEPLVKSGDVITEGVGGHKKWRAHELQPA